MKRPLPRVSSKSTTKQTQSRANTLGSHASAGDDDRRGGEVPRVTPNSLAKAWATRSTPTLSPWP